MSFVQQKDYLTLKLFLMALTDKLIQLTYSTIDRKSFIRRTPLIIHDNDIQRFTEYSQRFDIKKQKRNKLGPNVIFCYQRKSGTFNDIFFTIANLNRKEVYYYYLPKEAWKSRKFEEYLPKDFTPLEAGEYSIKTSYLLNHLNKFDADLKYLNTWSNFNSKNTETLIYLKDFVCFLNQIPNGDGTLSLHSIFLEKGPLFKKSYEEKE
jgi:hypothetical protein